MGAGAWEGCKDITRDFLGSWATLRSLYCNLLGADRHCVPAQSLFLFLSKYRLTLDGVISVLGNYTIVKGYIREASGELCLLGITNGSSCAGDAWYPNVSSQSAVGTGVPLGLLRIHPSFSSLLAVF